VRRDPEEEARFYTEAWERLGGAGYAQYEISNFARPGHQCRHNLNTWRMEEWIGLGPSSASQQDGWRGANVPDLDRWIAAVESGSRADTDRVELTERVLLEDSLIFGLRMNEGVDLQALRARFPGAPWAAIGRLAGRTVEEGLAVCTGDGRWSLTLQGRLVADAVGAEVMGAMDESGASTAESI